MTTKRKLGTLVGFAANNSAFIREAQAQALKEEAHKAIFEAREKERIQIQARRDRFRYIQHLARMRRS